jgi:hypothetical protein
MSMNQRHKPGLAQPAEEADIRLLNTSAACIDAYRAWRERGLEGAPALDDAIHELRRAMARIEIELAANHQGASPDRR